MKQKHHDYQLIPYPKLRRTMEVAERSFLRKPMIHGLCMTLSFDHSIVDGAPAARFTGRLKGLIESGYSLLDDSTVESELAVASGSVQAERK
jgi:2-oxoacid dehydrogenase/acyltransferase catalytic subunit